MRFYYLPLFLLAFATAACADDAPITVGGILVLSGDAANMGTAEKNGMVLAWESLPPEQQKRIKLVFEDDRLDSKTSVSAFQKLANSGALDVVVNSSSGTAKALAPLAEQKKIPLIAIATDPAVVRGRQYAFNLWVTVEAEAEAAVDESLKRGYKKIARISAQHDFTLACKDYYDKTAAERIQVVLDDEYTREEKDFRPFLTKLRAHQDVDAIFVNLFLGQIGIFAKQAREMGFKQPLFAFEFFEDPAEVKTSAGALVGQWYVQTDDPISGFEQKYLKRFPDAPFYSSANGYDAVMLIAEAIKTDPSREGIRKYLSSLKDFSGALGTYSASGDQRFTLKAAIKVVTETGFKKLH